MSELNPATTQRELERLSRRLDELVEELASQSRVAALAEVQHKKAVALRTIHYAEGGRKMTVDEREARVTGDTADLLEHRLVTAAVRDATQEASRAVRAQLSAVQSVAATMRELIR
jgi:hypothetical protein